MGRNILAVILGYAAMFIVVFVALVGVFLAIGQDRAFEPGVYEVSMLWIAVWGVTSSVAAIIGGFVCVKVGKTKGAVMSLMILVVLLGGLTAVAQMASGDPAPEDLVRAGDVSAIEAMGKARSPMWVSIANPIIGAVGVMVGASLGCGCRRDETSEDVAI
ncbi:MAG: hypothetical protein JJ974_12425 [Phycisphaerales bacterium]|nr:hypothetical protein [Phycisphaerales bacterium]